jgi:hypothetical protein
VIKEMKIYPKVREIFSEIEKDIQEKIPYKIYEKFE